MLEPGLAQPNGADDPPTPVFHLMSALSQARLTVRGDGKVLWKLRKPWRDGTRAFVFEPFDQEETRLERLVAIMPHPREHQLTYHGTLAPASPLRDEIVLRRPSARGNASCAEGGDECTRKKRVLWADLLDRVFGVDILRCPRCGGRRHMIAQITDPLAIRKVLGHLGLRTEQSYAMFSNLLTEGGRSNHLLVPAWDQPFGYQRDLVEVVESTNPRLQQVAQRRQRIAYFELRRTLSENPQDSVAFVRDGVRIDLEHASADAELSTPPSLLARKFLRFRPIDAEGRERCRH